MKNKTFNIKYLPMDIGRAIYFILTAVYRPLRLDENGNKYKDTQKGGSIIVANHSGFGDPFALGVCFYYRRVFFLAAEAVMRNRVIAFLLKGIGCIKIDRNISDIEAINKSVKILKDGKRLVMFPQGSIERNETIDSVKTGAILLSLQSGAPIIPVYSLPRKHFWNRRTFVFGKEIYCKDYIVKKIPSVSDMEFAANVMKDRLRELESIYERIVG